MAIVGNATMIPAEYIALPSLNVTRAERAAISVAVYDGRLPGFKVARTIGEIRTGAVWVHKQQAESYLAFAYKPRNAVKKTTDEAPVVDSGVAQPITAEPAAPRLVELPSQSSDQRIERVERMTYSRQEVCTILDMSVTTLHRLEERGLIRAMANIGRHKKYTRAEVERFLRESTATG